MRGEGGGEKKKKKEKQEVSEFPKIRAHAAAETDNIIFTEPPKNTVRPQKIFYYHNMRRLKAVLV